MRKNYLPTIIAFGLLLAACSESQSGAHSEQLPILGWYGLPTQGDCVSVKHYREMAEAGFTINLPGDEVPKANSALAARYLAVLDTANTAGIKLMVNYKVLEKCTPDDLNKLVTHPALAGYTIRDEPSAKDFDTLAKIVKQIQTIDTLHFCYINLYPNYANDEQLGIAGEDAYRRHVQKYLAEVPVSPVSFDHYPVQIDFLNRRYLRSEFYENLEIIADESRKAGKPFWAFALSTAHYHYPTPTLADLRLQVYSNLAYGAQGIQYFTWFDPWGNTSNDSVPIRIDGTQSPVYFTVQAMNREIAELSKVFLNSKVIWTAHTGTVPKSCKPLDAALLPSVIKSLEISGTGALVSMLEKNETQYLTIVNHDINNNVVAKINGSNSLRLFNKSGQTVPLVEEQTLTPGDIIVLTWKAK
jgi:hypothetical protein